MWFAETQNSAQQPTYKMLIASIPVGLVILMAWITGPWQPHGQNHTPQQTIQVLYLNIIP